MSLHLRRADTRELAPNSPCRLRGWKCSGSVRAAFTGPSSGTPTSHWSNLACAFIERHWVVAGANQIISLMLRQVMLLPLFKLEDPFRDAKAIMDLDGIKELFIAFIDF